MTDVLYDGLINYDETFFISLAHVLNEEPVQPRDLEMMGMLLPLGIEKGKEFKPAAAEALAWLNYKATTDTTPWWPNSQRCAYARDVSASFEHCRPLTSLFRIAASAVTSERTQGHNF